MTNYLQKGTQLNSPRGVYTIDSVIGRGATAIAYIASFDGKNGMPPSTRILKECYPSYIDIARTDDGVLICGNCYNAKFEMIKRQFGESGTTQNLLRNVPNLKNLVPAIFDKIYANNTVYLDVVDFKGELWEHKSNLSLLDRIYICLSVSKAIKHLHEVGYLCLDLKPSNIIVLDTTSVTDDKILFIDFDSFKKKEDINFGNSLSFTEAWAAPEQINPYSYSNISEATDIYALGELIFWSVFNRHSIEREHRAFSVYPFKEDSEFKTTLCRKPIQDILCNIFRNTLRSAASNRWQSVDGLIECLELLVAELQKKEYLITSFPEPNEFFVGRDAELSSIGSYLANNKSLYLYGVTGIGKSELAKQFAKQNDSRYTNILYWRYAGDIESMVCDETNITIANVNRLENQSDASYCRYKLSKIRALIDENTLIIIDNLDIKEADIEQKQAWEMINLLPGKLIITTKVEQLEHLLTINEIESIDSLRQLFYYHFDPEITEVDTETVDQIISLLCNHTLLIELIAKQAKKAFLSPSGILAKLKETGFSDLNREYFGLKKDGHSYNATIQEHIQNVFHMSKMTFEQKCILAKMALMPPSGIKASSFQAFYSLEDYNIINWLIENGWLYREKSSDIIGIHPIIAKISIESAKETSDIIDSVMADSTKAIYFINTKKLPEKERIVCADAVALAIKNNSLNNKKAAIYLTLYTSNYSKYGNRKLKLALRELALKIYEINGAFKKYSAIAEHCYQDYVMSLDDMDKAIAIVKERLEWAKTHADYYTIGSWYGISLIIDEQSRYNDPAHYSPQKLVKHAVPNIIIYALKIIYDQRNKRPRYLNNAVLLDELDYDILANRKSSFYVDMYRKMSMKFENAAMRDLFYLRGSDQTLKNKIQLLRYTINLRGLTSQDQKLRNTANSIEIKLDEACIAFLKFDYTKAMDILQNIIEMYERHSSVITSTHYRVHAFISNVAIFQQNYQLAKEESELCIKICKELNRSNDYAPRIQLGRVCNLMKDIETSETINKQLLKEISGLDDEIKYDYLPDVIYNYACLLTLKGNHQKAIQEFSKAIYWYCKNEKNNYDWKGMGIARCYHRVAELCLKDVTLLNFAKEYIVDSDGSVNSLLSSAKEFYKDFLQVNPQHPEYLALLELIKEYKHRPKANNS